MSNEGDQQAARIPGPSSDRVPAKVMAGSRTPWGLVSNVECRDLWTASRPRGHGSG